MTSKARNEGSLRRLVRRWWAGVIYLAVCVAWIVWCCHDSLAGMFWPALAVASFPAALACAPWPPNSVLDVTSPKA